MKPLAIRWALYLSMVLSACVFTLKIHLLVSKFMYGVGEQESMFGSYAVYEFLIAWYVAIVDPFGLV